MKTEQAQWTSGKRWEPAVPGTLGTGANLVLLFGGTSTLKEQHQLDEVK